MLSGENLKGFHPIVQGYTAQFMQAFWAKDLQVIESFDKKQKMCCKSDSKTSYQRSLLQGRGIEGGIRRWL